MRREEFREEGPGPGAERVFADDPEMLAMIRKDRERAAIEGPPRRKPWWWQALLFVVGAVWAAVGTAPCVLLDVVHFHMLIPLASFLGGVTLALAILGHYPTRYELKDEQTGQSHGEATLWKRLHLGLRLGGIAFALLAPSVAYGLLLLE